MKSEKVSKEQPEQLGFEKLCELVPDLLCIASTDGYFKRLNLTWEHTLGFSLEELLSQPFLDFVHPDDIEATHQAIEKLKDEKTAHFTNRYRTKDGSYRWLEWNAGAVQGEPLIYASARDVTIQKLAEESLRESEERYRNLAELTPDGLLIHAGGKILFANHAAANILGATTPEELLGKKLLNFVHPDFHAVVIERVKELTDNTNKVPLIEEKLIRLDHIVIDAEVAAFPFKYGGENAVQVVFRDITDRKRAEAQIAKSLEEKEILLRELYHRTRNNMSIIMAMLEIQASHFDDPRLRKALANTQNRIRSMALVHQKLYEANDLSRINLKEYIHELVALLMSSYTVSSNQVSIVEDMEDVFTLIDTAIPCGLILNELISNTFKYAFLEERRGEIKIQLHRNESREVELCVADNGVGVPPGFDFRHNGHLGMQNIFVLAEYQLHGQIKFDTSQGVACYLKFRDALYQPRI